MFWLYCNLQGKTAKIHVSECPSCNAGMGHSYASVTPLDKRWLGPYESEGAAREAAIERGLRVELCLICSPEGARLRMLREEAQKAR